MNRREAVATNTDLTDQRSDPVPAPCERCDVELSASFCPGCDEQLCSHCWANGDHHVCEDCWHETRAIEDIQLTTTVL